jgi:hypothetical protein
MTKLTLQPLRFPTGPVTWEAFGPWFSNVVRDQLRLMDVRDNTTGFADGLIAYDTGRVTLGDSARSVNQRVVNPVTTANRNSVQNVDTVLTATSGASVSAIAIAAHSVKFDFGSVSYNGGTISGLVAETLYYVYADDLEHDGGAVTYLATTNPDNLIATGRYYVGFVTTPVTGSTQTLSAATNGVTVEFTTAGSHGWSNGQTVTFGGFTDVNWTALNGTTKVITVTAGNKFTVAVDTTTYGAYTSGGTATRVTSAVQTGGGAGGGIGGFRWDYPGAIP